MTLALKTIKAKKIRNMKIKFISIIVLCFAFISVSAQQRVQKIKKTVDANKDVTIDLNTSHTNIEIDTWDRNKIEVEAYIESEELSKDELDEIAENWEVDIDGKGDLVEISTGGNYNFNWNFNYASEEASEALRELQLAMANMPELPPMPPMPEMPPIPELDFEMPEMPELPELPELPEGVYGVSFDTKAYEKEGEAYLDRWSKEYEEKYGKEFKDKMEAWAREFSKVNFDDYSERMEEWGKKFGERFGKDFERDMEKWGEEYGKRFDGKWARDMEKWGEEFGEKFGKDMEKWGEEFGESFARDMEKWAEEFADQFEEEYGEELEEREARMEERMKERAERMAERAEERAARAEERAKELEERMVEREAKRAEMREKAFKSRNKIKRVLKIKMPKDAKLKMDVRHGELKFGSVIYNLKADLSHSRLAANGIDGRNTSINASYTLVNINDWRAGNLYLNYVDNANLNAAKTISLTSNSSNVNINNLTGSAIIDGSFGDLIINSVSNTFSNLNIVLENSDAYIQLPKTDYDLIFKGNRSKLNKKRTDKYVMNNYPEGQSGSNRTILVNAKFSNVVMQ